MKKIKLQLVLLGISICAFSQTRTYSVIGSSTAAGVGVSAPDSSWVNRLTRYYTQSGFSVQAYNLAVSNRNNYHGMPSWYTPPAGRDYPLPNENITKALSLNPETVIVNYPSNNFNFYSISEILNSLQTIKDAANAAGKTCYIATSQPRMDASFPDLAARTKLKLIRDSIMNRFGNYAIDFFTDLADPVSYQIRATYSAGDGVHLNDRGHALLFERVKAKNIFSISSPPPFGCDNIVASAVSSGINVSGLTAPVVTVQVFNNNWATVYNQTFTNSPGTISISSLLAGTYHITVGFYNSSWSPICNKSQTVAVQTSTTPPPPVSNCNNITASAISGGIMFGGLSAPVVGIQVFNSNWSSVYNQSYNNSPGTVSVTPLTAGTYHTKVTFSTSTYGYICEKMQDIVVQSSGTPPPATSNCTSILISTIPSGVKLKGLVAQVVSVQVYNNNWATVYNQSFANSPDSLILTSLVAGTYHVKATLLTSAYTFICEKMQDVIVTVPGTLMNIGSRPSVEGAHATAGVIMRSVVNPFSARIRFEINSPSYETGSIIITDMNGKTVFEKAIDIQPGNNKYTIDGHRYTPGNYFLRCITAKGFATVKLIKQ